MRRAPRQWVLPEGEAASQGGAFERIVRSRGATLESVRARAGADDQEHDPFLLADMERAVALLRRALAEDRSIAIYGDYDADGVTASAVLLRALRARGRRALAYIPRRQAEGYGLNREALLELRGRGVELVITVDCGTTAVEVVRQRPAGLELIITDHHLPLAGAGSAEFELAPADALVNPQRPDDLYPFKGLAGVGVAFKLVRALETVGELPVGTAAAQLPLVALGTVADMVPLLEENRELVRRGLAGWAEDAPLGLRALARVAGVTPPLGSADLAFSLGPRINAAGRMEDAEVALRCCLAESVEEAEAAAARLQALNRDRRLALAQALVVARPAVEALAEGQAAIVLGSSEIPPGVVGLVAGRLSEEFGRPSFVYNRSGAEWRGSARGVSGLDVVRVLSSCREMLLRYGGHRGAGGFTLSPEPGLADRLPAALGAAVAEQLGARAPLRTFQVDARVELGECDLDLAEQLQLLQPCGVGNPPVLLCASDCRVVATEPLGRDGAHLRVRLADRAGRAEAITFNRPHLRTHLPAGRRVDALFELELDRWRSRRRARLLLRDLRPAQA
ncbi:MAG: single-stranded-DNA-specific exonuclease RecJ [Candidatus Dormibacteria bacterium]